jgi:hypothetical protein
LSHEPDSFLTEVFSVGAQRNLAFSYFAILENPNFHGKKSFSALPLGAEARARHGKTLGITLPHPSRRRAAWQGACTETPVMRQDAASTGQAELRN